jgi:hypothetical protein
VILADVSLGDILWSMLVFFFWFMLILIFLQILMDLFRDDSESGGMKALWVIFLILVPPFAMLIYLIVRGRGMAERNASYAKASQKQYDEYIKSVASTGTPTDQIAKAHELLDKGAIDQAEFDSIKAKALAS